MKRISCLVIGLLLAAVLCGCGTGGGEPAPAVETSAPVVPSETVYFTPAPTPPPVADEDPEPVPVLVMPELTEDWAEGYLTFLDDNYDIFASLWPEGLAGVGFIDLDLDETPEMLVFDQGASATMGVQLFDQIDGQVYCVSSVLDSAAGAFGDEVFSDVSVCASFFESFRLTRTEDGFCFWVDSANGTMETSWDEIIRFDSADGVLTPVSVCERFLECDPETGLVVTERYTVEGEETDADGYQAAAAAYTDGADMAYDAKGVFLWNNQSRYDTNYDGLMAMAQDAAKAYAPIAIYTYE